MIATSLLWAVPVALVAGGFAAGSILGAAAFMVGWITLGPATAAAWTVGNRIARGTSGGIRDFLDALRTRAVQGILFLLVDALIIALLVANVRFYFSSTVGILGVPVGWLGQGLRVGQLVGLLWMSVLTLWGLLHLYVPALLVEQDVGVGRALRRAAVLVLDNVPFTLALAAVVLLLAGLLMLSGVGAFALFAGMMAVLTNNAVRQLLTRYAVGDERTEGER